MYIFFQYFFSYLTKSNYLLTIFCFSDITKKWQTFWQTWRNGQVRQSYIIFVTYITVTYIIFVTIFNFFNRNACVAICFSVVRIFCSIKTTFLFISDRSDIRRQGVSCSDMFRQGVSRGIMFRLLRASGKCIVYITYRYTYIL